MKIDGTKLRAHLDAMHAHANARDLQSEAIRKVVGVAKGDGFDGKALRKVFVRERMDAAQRQTDDDMLAAYEAALGAKGRALKAIEAGAGVGEAAEANGIHRATLARARHVAKQPENATVAKQGGSATEDFDPETGEITENGATSDTAPGDDTRTPEPSRSAEVVANESSGQPDPAPVEVAAAANTSGPLDTDTLDIPPFLDRRARVA